MPEFGDIPLVPFVVLPGFVVKSAVESSKEKVFVNVFGVKSPGDMLVSDSLMLVSEIVDRSPDKKGNPCKLFHVCVPLGWLAQANTDATKVEVSVI